MQDAQDIYDAAFIRSYSKQNEMPAAFSMTRDMNHFQACCEIVSIASARQIRATSQLLYCGQDRIAICAALRFVKSCSRPLHNLAQIVSRFRRKDRRPANVGHELAICLRVNDFIGHFAQILIHGIKAFELDVSACFDVIDAKLNGFT